MTFAYSVTYCGSTPLQRVLPILSAACFAYSANFQNFQDVQRFLLKCIELCYQVAQPEPTEVKGIIRFSMREIYKHINVYTYIYIGDAKSIYTLHFCQLRLGYLVAELCAFEQGPLNILKVLKVCRVGNLCCRHSE